MILFTKIRYKNILSTGNAWTEIQLDNAKSTLIVGENGAGKSTILDAISFALYGKAFRNINKPQLLNSINKKNLEVELFFTIADNEYVIKRGLKPALFEIWKNGQMINQDAAARDYQQYLEENVLKMNFKSFGQIVVLGSSTFVPFMQLTAKARREIIEDLLDIQIFTSMNVLLKDKVLDNKNEIMDIKYRIDLCKNKIDSAKEHNNSIRELKRGEVKKIKDKMKEQIAFVEDQTDMINGLDNQIEILNSRLVDRSAVERDYQTQLDTVRQANTKISSIAKEIKFYEKHDNCPTCKQGIAHDFKENVISEQENEIAALQLTVENHTKKANSLKEKLIEFEGVDKEINKVQMEIAQKRANINMAKNALKSLKSELDTAMQDVVAVDDAHISSLESELVGHHSRQTELFDERETLNIVGSLLKDGGIKTRIIKQYIPVMNKLINKYLAAMDFFVDFQLDESFNETIKSRYRDEFSYSSFSEGEKLRINLAILFTWRAISKLRNSTSTNLLLMDEIMDSSLDNAGTEEFLKIINELTADSNIFIISHKGDQMFDKFDQVIRFEKVKNFSRIAA